MEKSDSHPSHQTFPDYLTKTARVRVDVVNTTDQAQEIEITIQNAPAKIQAKPGHTSHEAVVKFGDDAALWNEFTPVLHPVLVSLQSAQGREERTEQVGLRNLATEGKKFLVNGRETFMRGTLDCAIFPKTGYPPTSVEEWLTHLGKMKASGINHVRFHSWCPPQAAFVAADQLGMYLLPEAGLWLREDPKGTLAEWIHRECRRILDTYGNHPSFACFTHGNEPIRQGNMNQFLEVLARELKAYDNRMLHTGAANFIQTPEDQFTIKISPRGGPGWGGRGYRVDTDRPHIQHEPGQHCVYPNFDEMAKYTGPLKPKNFEIFMEQAQENGVLEQWRDFFMASGKLQVLCYKADCEAALISPDIAATQLLGISDFSGQGTALVGYLDAFYDEKPYFTKAEFSQFWSHSVPLARMTRFTFANSERLDVEVLYAYFGEKVLTDQTLNWEITDPAGKVQLSGSFPGITLDNGRTTIGRIQADLASLQAPRNYTLTLALQGTEFQNNWDFWVYEDAPSLESGEVLVAHDLDAAAQTALQEGKSVLLFPQTYSRAHRNMAFSPVFWNRFMFMHRNDHTTLGLLIKNEHPALAHFPGKFHSDWNWMEIVEESHGLVMENLPREGLIVQPIDDWNTNRLLGSIFEYKVGPGKLLVSMSDLSKKQKKSLPARQLYSSLLRYMNSAAFDPAASTTVQDLQDAFDCISQKSKLQDMGARLFKTHQPSAHSAKHAIDGDPGTAWEAPASREPFVTLDLGESQSLQGVRLENTNIRRMEILMGDDANQLSPIAIRDKNGKSIPSVAFTESEAKSSQEIPFFSETTGRYLKISMIETHGDTLKIGELDIIKIFE
ncbi:MAG: hypothetical protein HC888_03535 [Candidatus Competibacteraceae bacterium]|nr:hypothetical protein [Candidatus Competibacteraceae bacterium]